MQLRLIDLAPEIDKDHFANPEKRLLSKREKIEFNVTSSRRQLRDQVLMATRESYLQASKQHTRQVEARVTLPGLSKRLQQLKIKEEQQKVMNQTKVFFEASKLYALLAGHPEVFKILTVSEASLAQSGMKTKAAALKAQDVSNTKTAFGESPTTRLNHELTKIRSTDKLDREREQLEEYEKSSKVSAFVKTIFSGPRVKL